MRFYLSLKIIVGVLISLSIASPCLSADRNINVLAEVGEKRINSEDFLDILILYRKSGDIKKLSETLTQEGKEKILNEVIELKLLALKAMEMGIDKEPATRRSIEFAIDSILSQRLVEHETGSLDLSDSGLRRYYDSNQKEFMTERRVKARHIITKTREEVEDALQEISRGRDFSEVASGKNIDATKQHGGELGWVVRGVMVKPFEEVLFSLKQGEISDVVKTSFGYHIIKVEEIDEGRLQNFSAVKETVKEKLINAHLDELKKDLKRRYSVKINKEALEGFDK